MRIFKCKNCGIEEEITSTTVLIGQCEVCEGVMTPLTTDKEPVAKLQCSDGVSLTYTLDRLLLEARGVAKVLADNAKHDLNLDTADYWYDIEEQILRVYSDLQKAG